MKKNNLQHIYWFAYFNESSPSVRYRATYPLKYLEEEFQIGYSLVYPSYKISALFKFFKIYFSILFFRKKNSLIVIQRVNSSFIYANLLLILVKIRNKNTIYDLDDAIYLEETPKTIFKFMKVCSKLMLGSEELAIKLDKYNSNHFINTSPVVDLKIVKTKRNKTLKIGWIGYFGGDHKKSLEKALFPALSLINFNIELIILGVFNKEGNCF